MLSDEHAVKPPRGLRHSRAHCREQREREKRRAALELLRAGVPEGRWFSKGKIMGRVYDRCWTRECTARKHGRDSASDRENLGGF